jgi:predicted DNA-binding protein (MmcQ/YjbR family)
VLYFADGTNIRMVDRDGIVTTIIGNHMHKSHWKPIPCEGTLNVEEVFSFLKLAHFVFELLVQTKKYKPVAWVFLAPK